jgi:hypothetical protein
MDEKLTLLQRITSATPVFFKRVQVFGVGLAGLGGTLAAIHGIPANLTTTLISAGTALAALAQFAVETKAPQALQGSPIGPERGVKTEDSK